MVIRVRKALLDRVVVGTVKGVVEEKDVVGAYPKHQKWGHEIQESKI